MSSYDGYLNNPSVSRGPVTNPAGIRPVATVFLPDDDTLAKVEAIAERLTSVVHERKQLEEEEKFLRQRLATLLPMGTTKAGRHTVNVRVNKRFDVGTARSVLTLEELGACTDHIISASKAREVLPPERYAQCQAETGEPVVRVS